MKTGLKVVMLGALLFAGSMVASANNNIVVLPYQNTTYTLVAAEVSNSAIQSLVILDDRGEVVYSSRPAELDGNYGKLFDFSRLSDGTYKVRVRSKSGEVSVERFVIKNGAVVKENKQLQAGYENDLRIWSNENFVFVSHINRDASPALVTVEDAYGQVVYDQALPTELTYSGKYNLAALPRGEYQINVVSGSKVANYAFRK